jgi:hypothetical protein
VIQHVDDTDRLETPLVVIDYSQMFRGDSFRSDCRVPTHICCALRTAMSIEKMVQTMGRATASSEASLFAPRLHRRRDHLHLAQFPSILRAPSSSPSTSYPPPPRPSVFSDRFSITKRYKLGEFYEFFAGWGAGLDNDISVSVYTA